MHLSMGVEKPILYRIPPTAIYPLALLFMIMSYDGSSGRFSCSMYSLIGVIQEKYVGSLMAITVFSM